MKSLSMSKCLTGSPSFIKRILFFIAIVAVVNTCAIAAEFDESVNLIQCVDYESCAWHHSATGSDSFGYTKNTVDSGSTFAGTSCAQFAVTDSTTAMDLRSQYVLPAVEPNKQYRFQFDYKTLPSGTGGFYVYWRFFDKDLNFLGQNSYLFGTTDGDWQRGEFIDSVPAVADEVLPVISDILFTFNWAGSTFNGTVRLDNFVMNPAIAAEEAPGPTPADSRKLVPVDIDLNWPDAPAGGYHVYFGTDHDEVNNAQPLEGDMNLDGNVELTDLKMFSTNWLTDSDYTDFALIAKNWKAETVFKGYQDINTYDPGTLQPSGQYYWRIDAVDTAVTKGDTWNFKVIDQSANQFFPVGSPPAATVDVVDLTGQPKDKILAAVTLQGQINKGSESKVFVKATGWDPFWLSSLQQLGHIQQVNNLSMSAYFLKYSMSYDKVVVYDPDLLATINIATMIASLENAIVIHPDDIGNYGASKTVQDLRGLWTTNVDAYQWAFDNLWPDMNQNIISCYHPTALGHYSRDYMIRFKVFPFWVTNASQDDPPKSDYSSEYAFLEQLLAASPPNTPVIGFWYNGPDALGIGETEGLRLSSKYGKLSMPAGWPTNMSFISGNVVDWPTVLSQYHNRAKPPAPTLDNNKVYISFDVVDSGDAPAYWMYRQYDVWQDSNRGNVPISWSLGPGTVELMPSLMEWFYTQATGNDSFYMGLSGAGYTFPYNDFMSLTDYPAAAWGDYLSLTQHYIDRLGIKQVGLYTNVGWADFNPYIQDPITQKFGDNLSNIDTLILGLGRDGNVYPDFNYTLGDNGVLVSHVTTRWNTSTPGPENDLWLTNEIINNTPPTRPAFMHVMALSWACYPSNLVNVLNQLGNDYVAVSAEDLNALYWQANNP